MLGEHLDQYTFEYLLQDCLDRIPGTIDKREGSIIYDAVAPACAALAQAYIELKGVLIETYALTANGIYLDYRVAEHGLTRYPAGYAIKKAHFLDGAGKAKEIPLGSVFSTIGESPNLKYKVTDIYRDEDENVIPGYYRLTCEESGSIGNDYFGDLLPVSVINDLSVAYMDDVIFTARNEETDEELRQRFKEKVDTKAFGGNIAQYREQILGLEMDHGGLSIGAVQIYPVWNGGGTVKCSIVDTDFNAITEPQFLKEVQRKLDPVADEEDPDANGSPAGEVNFDRYGSSAREGTGLGLGLAPIGHKVTVTSASEVPLNIHATVSLSADYQAEQVRPAVEKAVSDYLLGVRKNWGISDALNQYFQRIFLSQINYAILSVAGVENVSEITINGEAKDLSLREDAEFQEIPVVGEVSIHVD